MEYDSFGKVERTELEDSAEILIADRNISLFGFVIVGESPHGLILLEFQHICDIRPGSEYFIEPNSYGVLYIENEAISVCNICSVYGGIRGYMKL